MTSALNLISENCKHPFPPLCLILNVSSLPEDHLSSFGVAVSHPYLILHASLPAGWRAAHAHRKPSALSPRAHSSLFFPLLSIFFFFFFHQQFLAFNSHSIKSRWFCSGGFFHRPGLSPLSQWPLAYTLCLWGKKDLEVSFKNGLSSPL